MMHLPSLHVPRLYDLALHLGRFYEFTLLHLANASRQPEPYYGARPVKVFLGESGGVKIRFHRRHIGTSTGVFTITGVAIRGALAGTV